MSVSGSVTEPRFPLVSHLRLLGYAVRSLDGQQDRRVVHHVGVEDPLALLVGEVCPDVGVDAAAGIDGVGGDAAVLALQGGHGGDPSRPHFELT